MTIWFDFTTTVRNRSRNGIANVEWHIGTALLQLDPSVRCFVLATGGDLVEIDPERDLAAAVYASTTEPDVVGDAPGGVGPRSIARLGVLLVLGERSGPMLGWLLRAEGSVRRRMTVASSGVIRRLPSRPNVRSLEDRVAADDIVVSMGAEWSGVLADRLGAVKRSTGCRVVTMVYDLIPLTHPHLAFHQDRDLFASYYRALTEVSDLITCISEQSRRDLATFVEAHGLASPPTRVLRLGDGPTEPVMRTRPREPFFLVVGTVERRKNVDLLYDALRILDDRGEPLPTVVVAGSEGWGTGDLLDEIRQQSTPASRAIVLLGSIDDQLLDSLLWRTRALLFPSHYEGWGLPLREAAVRGCPIAVGDSPAARDAVDGYGAATVLPTDDPTPWADYMASEPVADARPAEFWAWSSSAELLVSLIDADLGHRSFQPARG